MAETGNLFFDVSTEVGKQKATAQQWRDTIRDNQSFKETELERLGLKGFLAQWRGKNDL